MRAFLSAVLTLIVAQRAAGQMPLPLAWEYATPLYYPQGLLCDDRRPILYAALKNGGLAIFDIPSPLERGKGGQRGPRELAAIRLGDLNGLDVMHLTRQGDVLYLALGSFFDAKGSPAGLAAVNVQNPHSPRVLSLWKSAETLRGAATVLVRGQTAYLGAMSHGVFIFDVADPANIRKIAAIRPDVDFPLKNPGKIQHPNARGLAIKGNLLFVAYDAGGLRVIDVADRLRPREIGRYINAAMGKKQQAYNNLVIDGDRAFIAVDYAGLEIVDIRAPGNIKQIGWWNPWKANTLGNLWFNSPGHTNQLEHDAGRKLVYLSAGGSDLQVVSVAIPSRPTLSSVYGDPKDKLGVWGLSMSDDHVYLAYIHAFIPFRGTWSGIKAVRR